MPFVLLETGAQGLHVAVANAAARALGVTPGLGFSDARARVPHLRHQEIDRAGDADALTALAGWLVRFAPLAARDGRDALLLETTGCDHLYGGEVAMMAEMTRLLNRDGLPHAAGLASTPGAASALARAWSAGQPRPGILTDGEERAGLADLPVAALRLTEEAETLLRRFGLTRIGQLYGIDRAALARRFQSKAAAEAVLLRLDQALGLRHEPISPLRPAPARTARLACTEPLISRDAIALGLVQLTVDLCEGLAAFGQGARGFTLHAFRADGTASCVEISAARPVRTPQHIVRLFDERLDQLDPGFGIDLLVLEARRTGPMEVSAVALSGDLAARDTDEVALAALADRITARFGEGMVTVDHPVASHIPERAQRSAPFAGGLPALSFPQTSAVPSPGHLPGPRPLRLLQPPERVRVMAEVPDGPPLRFVWRRVGRSVIRADGPERLSPEWWTHHAPPPPAPNPQGSTRARLSPKLDPRADAAQIACARTVLEAEAEEEGEVIRALPRARDYYRVEDASGHRYWLYREGLYDDGRGASPDWFVHGLFA